MAYKLVSHVILGQRFFVHKINYITYRERLFCILDRKQPFELILSYKKLNKSTEFAPIIGGQGGFQIQDSIDLQTEYKFRLETKEECLVHINDVQRKRELIDEMLIGFTDDMMLDHNRKILKTLENFSSKKNQ